MKSTPVSVCLLLLSGCTTISTPYSSSPHDTAVVSPTQAGQTAEAPTVPANTAEGAALAESVRAYLRAFNLDEKTLPAGLTIPYALGAPPKGDSSKFGFARATGKQGPGGHQVYEVTYYDGVNPGAGGELSTFHYFIEIAPEASVPVGSSQ
jgi:hypothetical protein